MFSKNPMLVLVLGFIAGCGAAALAPLVIPPAHAQVTQRWEIYVVRTSGYVDEETAIANAAGREGWEPFQVAAPFMYFKRPAQ